MNTPPLKPIAWMGSSKKDLGTFPAEVQDEMGRALLDVQFGDTPRSAKPLKGFRGAGVLEVIEDHVGDTYRAVYTVRFSGRVYVLHAFQKKSKRGIKTPKADRALIDARYKMAAGHYRQHGGNS